MNVDDVVAAKIEAARVRIQAAKRRREELAAARRRGLAARHAAKVRRLSGGERDGITANQVLRTEHHTPNPEQETP